MFVSFFSQDLRQRLLATLAYTSQFQFPLSSEELWDRLVADEKNPPSKMKKSDFFTVLKQLEQDKHVIKKGRWYVLPGNTAQLNIRSRRQEIARRKWQEADLFVHAVSFLPWIKAIFVTGSLAMENVEAEDDVDLMIIASPNSLWLTRAIVLLIATLYGKRRSWQEKKHQGWCLNLWLDTDHLAVPIVSQGIYQAYEVSQARPIFNREKTVQTFYDQNTWVRKWLPNFSKKECGDDKQATLSPLFFFNPFFSAVDYLSFFIQSWYMKPHQTSEKVGRGFAFFHPRNTEHLVYQRWKTSFENSLK